jgi:hypothetical protein
MASGCSNITTPTQWVNCQLAYGGFKQTKSNENFMMAWYVGEGGNWMNSASYNPLNTSYTDSQTGSSQPINSDGVRAYSSWSHGLYATNKTIMERPNLVKALRSGDAGTALMSGQLTNELQAPQTGWCPGCHGYVSTMQQNYVGLQSEKVPFTKEPGHNASKNDIGAQGAVSSNAISGGSGVSKAKVIFGQPCQGTLIGLLGSHILTACQAKALISGFVVLGSGFVMLTGLAIIVAGAKSVQSAAKTVVQGSILGRAAGGAMGASAAKRSGPAPGGPAQAGTRKSFQSPELRAKLREQPDRRKMAEQGRSVPKGTNGGFAHKGAPPRGPSSDDADWA